jgi:ATP-binding cassette subfamily B protein
VFSHVQRQPIAFFTRAQTGSLVARLDADVMGAQQAIVGTLSGVLANVLSLAVILAALFYLSWLVTVIALVLIPVFLIPARVLGRRMQRLTREGMQLNAEMGSMMNERFNVAGAMLVKLFGRPREESELFSSKAGKVRDIGVTTAMYGQVFFVALTLLAALVTAVVYGVGGSMVIRGAFQIGSLVALTQLLGRVYGPIAQLSNVQVQVMTAPRRPAERRRRRRPGDQLRGRVLPLPDRPGGVARLAGVDRAEDPRARRRRRRRPARRVLHRARRVADRARRALRRRQDDHHPAGVPDV